MPALSTKIDQAKILTSKLSFEEKSTIDEANDYFRQNQHFFTIITLCSVVKGVNVSTRQHQPSAVFQERSIRSSRSSRSFIILFPSHTLLNSQRILPLRRLAFGVTTFNHASYFAVIRLGGSLIEYTWDVSCLARLFGRGYKRPILQDAAIKYDLTDQNICIKYDVSHDLTDRIG